VRARPANHLKLEDVDQQAVVRLQSASNLFAVAKDGTILHLVKPGPTGEWVGVEVAEGSRAAGMMWMTLRRSSCGNFFTAALLCASKVLSAKMRGRSLPFSTLWQGAAQNRCVCV
jgi:hypothetical protein